MVYDVIGNEEFQKYKKLGIKAIHTMCNHTIKNKDGYPDREKCRKFVLGNQDPTYYPKHKKYVPALKQNQFDTPHGPGCF